MNNIILLKVKHSKSNVYIQSKSNTCTTEHHFLTGTHMDLQHRWLSTAIDVLKISGDLPQKWWGVIEGRYSEKQRHYHTLRHLEEMFQHFDKYFKKLNQPELVVLAIFFHE